MARERSLSRVVRRQSRAVGGWDLAGTALLAVLALGWTVPMLWTVAVAVRPPDISVATGSPWFAGDFSLANFAEAKKGSITASLVSNSPSKRMVL